jgi:hypothetical protein
MANEVVAAELLAIGLLILVGLVLALAFFAADAGSMWRQFV